MPGLIFQGLKGQLPQACITYDDELGFPLQLGGGGFDELTVQTVRGRSKSGVVLCQLTAEAFHRFIQFVVCDGNLMYT